MSSEQTPDFNPIESLLLTAYPNPERRGCISSEELLAMGHLGVRKDHPGWNHVWHCSPCFAQFKAFRDQRWEAERIRQTKRRYLAISAACLAILVLLVTTTLQTRHAALSPNSSSQDASLKIDLSNFEAVRGFSPDTVHPSFTLPRRLDEVEVRLPRFAHPGRYEVAILNSSTLSAAFISSVKVEEIGNSSLAKIHFDLCHVARGDYNMSFHGGQPAVDFSVPVRVE